MIGVLGIDPLLENIEEECEAYFEVKDEQKEKKNTYGIRDIMPNLYTQYGKRKDQFTKIIDERQKDISKNEQQIRIMETIKTRTSSSLDFKKMKKEENAQDPGSGIEFDQLRPTTRQRSFMKNRTIESKIHTLKTMEQKRRQLQDNIETTRSKIDSG